MAPKNNHRNRSPIDETIVLLLAAVFCIWYSSTEAHEFHGQTELGRGEQPSTYNQAISDLNELLHFPGSNQLKGVQQSINTARFTAADLLDLSQGFIDEARKDQNEAFFLQANRVLEIHDLLFNRSDASDILRTHILMQFHRFKEAETLARKLLVSKQHMAASILLGDALLDQGRLSEAESYYLAVIRKKMDFSMLARMASLRWQQGRHENALNFWEQCHQRTQVEAPESQAWSLTHLGEAYLQEGDTEAAANYIQQALFINPDFAKAHFLMSRIQWYFQKPVPAMRHLEKRMAKPSSFEALWWEEDLLFSEGKLCEASEITRRLLWENAGHDRRLLALYLAYHDTGLVRAEKLAHEEFQLRQDALTQSIYAFTLFKTGKQGEAEKHLFAALDQGYLDARTALITASITRNTGKREVFEKYLRTAKVLRAALLPTELDALRSLEE